MLRDRRLLSAEGVIVVVVTVDAHSGAIVQGPEIITRGWVYAPEAEDLLEEARKHIVEGVAEAAVEGATDIETMKRHVRQSLGRFVKERTQRRPLILPIVMEV